MAGGPVTAESIGEVFGQRLLSVLEAEEEKLDNELHKLERMDEDEMESLRRQRMDHMRKVASQKSAWLAAGHGEYREIDDQKRFFDELKAAPRAVVHFYRPTTRRCEIIDRHAHVLARKHVETKFLRVNAEKAPFIAERLKIWMIPTIVLIKEGRTEHSIVGFDELGGRDDFATEDLERLLLQHGAILESFC
jgi:hypothetical protein